MRGFLPLFFVKTTIVKNATAVIIIRLERSVLYYNNNISNDDNAGFSHGSSPCEGPTYKI